MGGCAPQTPVSATVCASTLIFVCTAIISILGCSAIALFYAELNDISSLSSQPLKAISFLLGEAIGNEIDNVIYNMAAATRLFASKIVVTAEQSLEHNTTTTLAFLELLMRNDTFAELTQINFLYADNTTFIGLTTDENGTKYASVTERDDGCKLDFYYPSMEPYPAAGKNVDCEFKPSETQWFDAAVTTPPGELVWGMHLDGESLLERAKSNSSTTAQIFCALPLSDDNRLLGIISTISYGPALVAESIQNIMTNFAHTSSSELLADTVVCIADRGSGDLLVAEVNNTNAIDAASQCNKTLSYVEDYFDGSLLRVVSDMWIDSGEKVISTHTPLLPVRLGRSDRIDWILWICDDAQHLQDLQTNSTMVTLALALAGIVIVGSIMFSRLRTVLKSSNLAERSLIDVLHDVNYRTHEVYVLVVIVVLIWWQISNNAVIVEYAQIILEVSSLNTVQEVSHMLSKPFILNSVMAAELPNLMQPSNMLNCVQENSGRACASPFFYDGEEFATCTMDFPETHNGQLWCQSSATNTSSWDRCSCSSVNEPSSVFDTWLIENVFAFTAFSRPVFSVAFGTSQGVYEGAQASTNETFMDQFSGPPMYPAQLLEVCNNGMLAVEDDCFVNFGSNFRGYSSQKGTCKPIETLIPSGAPGTLACVPSSVVNTSDARRLAEIDYFEERSFDELFTGNLELVSSALEDNTGGGWNEGVGVRQLSTTTSNASAKSTSCSVCVGQQAGAPCNYTSSSGISHWGYCGQFSLQEDQDCCLSYAIPELAVQACNFASVNSTCRYFDSDLDFPVQGFCQSITSLLPQVPNTTLFCHANFYARDLGSGETPYGLQFSIIARDSSTDMQKLKYGTYEDTASHAFDPYDYPYSNTRRDPHVVTEFASTLESSVATVPWFTDAMNAQTVSGPVLFEDESTMYIDLQVTKRVSLTESGVLPTPDAVLRIFVDLVAATSILDFSNSFSLSVEDTEDDDSNFCFVVNKDGYLVLTADSSDLVNSDNTSELVYAGESDNDALSYVYNTLIDRFGNLTAAKQWLPWIGKIGQGLDDGVFDVYWAPTARFDQPGVRNDTGAYTVICALEHNESFHLILLWAYKATLIGVGIIFVNLIFSRVIVKAIVSVFESRRLRYARGRKKPRHSIESDDGRHSFEMTNAASSPGLSPSKRPKVAGLADFLYFYKGRKYCGGPLVAENFLRSHENLAKWLIRKGAEGYCVEDLLPLLPNVDMNRPSRRYGASRERFVADMQSMIARRRAASVMEYNSVLNSISAPTIGTGTATRNRAISLNIAGFSEASTTKTRPARSMSVSFAKHNSLLEETDSPPDNTTPDEAKEKDEPTCLEDLAKPYNIHTLYETMKSFFDNKCLWETASTDNTGTVSPHSKNDAARSRTRTAYGERFADGATDVDDFDPLDSQDQNTQRHAPPSLPAVTRRKLRHFNIHRSKSWKRVINLAILINCAVAFIEAPYVDRLTGRDDPRVTTAIVINFCCYIVYFVEFYLGYMASGFKVLRVDDDGKSFTMKINNVLVAWFVITSAMAIEWIVTVVDPNYNTGLNENFYEANGLDLQPGWFLFLPYTSILRPVLFILTMRSIRDCITSFTTTIVIYLKVFSLLAILLLLMALLGILIQPNTGIDNLELAQFDNFVAALIYAFDFLGSHENYPDVVYSSTGIDFGLSQMLMIISSIIGVVFVDALIISVFSEKYSEVAAVLKRQRHRCRRTAIVAAFMVLDQSQDNKLEQSECQGFFRQYWQFVDHFDDDNDHMLDVREFVGICEAFLDNNNTVLRAFFDAWEPTKKRRRCCSKSSRAANACRSGFLSSSFNFWTTILLFANAYVLFWYGILGSEEDAVNRFAVDLGACVFMLYWFVEVLIRFIAFGGALWNKPRDIYHQMKNRFEVIVSTAPVVLFVGVVVFKRYGAEHPLDSYFDFTIPLNNLLLAGNRTSISPQHLDWTFDAAGRLCFMIPLLRLLSTFPAVSRLFFGLLAILPIFWDVYATGLIIFYMFSGLGVLMFFGKYQVLLGDANEIPEATFDSFMNSIFVCFNLFNGESWDLLMEAGVNSTGLWYMSVYFVIQMVLLNMLFQDLITGIIIDASRNLSDLFEDDESAKVDTFAFWERLTHTRNDVVANGSADDDDGTTDENNQARTLGSAISKVLSVDFGASSGSPPSSARKRSFDKVPSKKASTARRNSDPLTKQRPHTSSIGDKDADFV